MQDAESTTQNSTETRCLRNSLSKPIVTNVEANVKQSNSKQLGVAVKKVVGEQNSNSQDTNQNSS